MSNQQTKKNAELSFHGFGGVDKTKGHSDPACAEDLLNFRIRKDGSLQKRCGYRMLTDIGSPIRSYWSGKMGGESYLFLATDETVFSVDPQSGEASAIASLASKGEPAVFFFYRDSVYLLNGSRFYRVTRESVDEVIGYVPLIGKDWDNRAVGEIYEPRNILTRKARISYIVSAPSSMFLEIPEKIEEIEKIEVNGEAIDPSRFWYDVDFNTINVTDLYAGDRIVAYVVFPSGSPELLRELCSCQQAATFGGPSSNRLFLWGGTSPTTMFSSRYVKPEDLREVTRTYSNCAPLYFPPGFEFTVGEGRHPVLGAERQYDRLLIFTEGDTWIASPESSGLDDFPTFGINAGIGCASPHGTALAENDPVTVGEYAIWQWSGETDRLNERNAIRLSEAIDSLLAPEDYRSASLYYNRREREIWVNLHTKNEVWIYHIGRRVWYRFGEIRAEEFFDLEADVAFLRGGKVFVFDEKLSVDREDDGTERPIEAYYLTTVSDFGTEEKKNLCRMILCGDLGGGSLTLTFSGNGIESVTCVCRDTPENHSVIQRRLNSGSFRYGSVRIRSSDRVCPIIHSLTLHTR